MEQSLLATIKIIQVLQHILIKQLFLLPLLARELFNVVILVGPVINCQQEFVVSVCKNSINVLNIF